MSANPFLLSDDPNQNPFDAVAIGGEYMPGLARVWIASKPSRKHKWDKKVGPGTVGDTLTYRGSLLVEFAIQLEFWEAEQVDEWDAKYPALSLAIGSKAQDIAHPTLDRLGVRAIVLSEIVQLFPLGVAGCAWAAQIGVNEYRPPPKVNVTGSPNGAANGFSQGQNGNGKNPTAKSAQEEEIAKLLKEAKK